MKRISNLGAILLVLGTLAAHGEANAVKPELGLGFVLSPGYRDTLDAAYSDADVSGGYGWLELYFGMRYTAFPQFELMPKIEVLANYVSSTGYGDSFANAIIQPAVNARYLFSEGDSFFVEGELSYNITYTGSDAFDVDGGIGYAGFVGYRWEAGVGVSIGYSMLATDVTYGDWDQESGDENFGGVELRFSATF